MFNSIVVKFRKVLRRFILWATVPHIKVYVVPNGRDMERKTGGAVGHDVYVRAIVFKDKMDQKFPYLRKTLYDFKSGSYALKPGEKVLIGIGVIIDMEFPLFYLVIPRSGLETKLNVTLANRAPIDSDYRGEAAAYVENRSTETFYLEHSMRIAQIIFHNGVIPSKELVANYEDLSVTDRGAKGFNSTGLNG
ncbi:MAG: hypothetical protein Q7S19_03775 [bacterium]|nr:hypothetical protein [bacterium]